MEKLFAVAQTMVLCGTGLGLVFIVLLSMPNSQLRAFLLPIVGWAVAIFCGVYCISPCDIFPEILLGPFGLIDDVGAIVTGISAAKLALSRPKDQTH